MASPMGLKRISEEIKSALANGAVLAHDTSVRGFYDSSIYSSFCEKHPNVDNVEELEGLLIELEAMQLDGEGLKELWPEDQFTIIQHKNKYTLSRMHISKGKPVCGYPQPITFKPKYE
jgi:hypothetical protein